MADVVSKVTMTRPYSIYFTCEEGLSYLYPIDAGGIRRDGEDVVHGTPDGSFSFTGKTFAEVASAAATLGARITPLIPSTDSTGAK